MEIKVRYVDKQLCQVHFAVPFSVVNKKYKEIKSRDNPVDDVAIMMVQSYVETELLTDELTKKGIIHFGDMKVHYLSPYNEGRPLIGVATFVVLPEVTNISLPMVISPNVSHNLEQVIEHCDESFDNALLEAGLYNLVDSTTVNETSIIDYQLLYTKNGTILNTINNQSFDMTDDDDLDPDKFMGAKINDHVICDQDDVTVEALILKIKNKVPFTKENNNIEMINDLDYNDFDDLYSKYKEAYLYIKSVEAYIDYIIEFSMEHTQLEISDAVYEFFKSKDYFAYYDEFYNAKDCKSENRAILKSIYLDLLNTTIDYSNEGIDSSQSNETISFNQLYDFYQNLYVCQDTNLDEVFFGFAKVKILNYCKKEKLIKGINIKL